VVSIGHVQASEAAIRQRLVARNSGKRREGDLSDADWSVYQWMVHAQEPIERPHRVLDTTNTLPDVLALQLRDYWFKREREYAPRKNHIQSNGWTSQL
jgi:predicted kinase